MLTSRSLVRVVVVVPRIIPSSSFRGFVRSLDYLSLYFSSLILVLRTSSSRSDSRRRSFFVCCVVVLPPPRSTRSFRSRLLDYLFSRCSVSPD